MRCHVMEITKEMNNHPEKYIKFVANYLRKSRGEVSEDLDKHRRVLTELCEKNNWKYVEYPEIESGDSIAARPIFQKLLKDIEEGIYDAVCVVDIDRLGRGDKGDQDKIQKIFMRANTLIATPSKVYNLVDEDDEFVVDMKGFLARREYKLIVKRLSQGKKVGSKRGDWTNGNPPYPYEYERYGDEYNAKGLVINTEKLKTYRYIIDNFLKDRIPLSEIAYDLNRQRIPSPRDCQWHENTLARIVIDETHLGKIISNKTKGDSHTHKKQYAKPVEYINRVDWVVIENCHQPVKTIEEHEQIIMFLSRRNKSHRKKDRIIKPLTSLVKCSKCGHSMSVLVRDDRKNPESLKPCWYHDTYGVKCENREGMTKYIYQKIDLKLQKYEDQLREDLANNKGSESSSIRSQIEKATKELNSKEKALVRIQNAYEAEAYTIQEFKGRKDIVNVDILKLEDELKILKSQFKRLVATTNEMRLSKIDIYKEKIKDDKITDVGKNKLLKSIIENIIWERNGDIINIEINFL